MSRTILALAALPFLLAAGPPAPSPEKADVAALQGLWVLKTSEYLGEKAILDPVDESYLWKRRILSARQPEERELPIDLKKFRTTLRFKGNTFEMRKWYVPFCGEEGGRVETIKGTYRLDVSRRPKVLKRWAKVWFLAVDAGKSVDCYYDVKGDTLRLAVWKDEVARRPKSFDTWKEKGLLVMVYRREGK
jgi:hypothetical protein